LMRFRFGFKIAFPTIMSQYGIFKTIRKIVIDSNRTTILRKGDKCGQFVLPRPEPAIFSVYLSPGFVRTYYTSLNFIGNDPVCRCCFLGKPLKNITNSALADGQGMLLSN